MSHHQSRRRLGAGLAVASVAAAVPLLADFQVASADTPPASLVGLVGGTVLVRFGEADPTSITGAVAITGLATGERIASIEVRPGTGQVLGLAITDLAGPDRGRLYRIDPVTGAATATGSATIDGIDDAARTTIDINPSVDRLRVVGTGDQNLRVNPNNGSIAATDTDLTGGSQVVAVAYDQNIAAAAAGAPTTLFGISAGGNLVRVGGVNGTPSPNAGAVTSVGSLGAVPDDQGVGFDISRQGSAFATMTVGGSTGLYRVDLTTGAATLVGAIGNGLLDVTDIAVLSDVVPAAASQYTALASASRLLDTRSTQPVAGGGTVDVAVRGTNGIAANATAAVLNVTVTNGAAPGFTTVWPSGTTRPDTSSVNTDAAGQTRAALVIVPIGADGRVRVFSERGSDVIVDVIGAFAPAANGAGRFNALTPGRLLDTRTGLGANGSTAKPAAGAAVDVQVTGRGGVPAAGVGSVVVNLTSVDSSAAGFATAYATGTTRPTASNLNASAAGETIANLAVVPVSAAGSISVFTENGAHLVVDVVGWFGSDPNALAVPRGLFVPLDPQRLLDTRNGIGAPDAPVAAGGTVAFEAAGRAGVPASGVSAIAGTVTATDTAASGFFTAFPNSATVPVASTSNADRAGQTIANAVMVGLGADGRVGVFSSSGAELVADVVGYYVG